MPQCPLITMGDLYTIANIAPRYLLSAWVISAWLACYFTVRSTKRHKMIHSFKQALNRSTARLGNTVKTNHTWLDQWGMMHWTRGSLGVRGPNATEQVWEENMKAKVLAGKADSHRHLEKARGEGLNQDCKLATFIWLFKHFGFQMLLYHVLVC